MQKMTRIFLDMVFYALNVVVALGFVHRGEFAYLVNPLMTLSTYLLITFLERRTGVRIKPFARICLIGSLLAHTVGEYYYVYERISAFDNILHGFGTFSFTIVGYSLFQLLHLQSRRPLLATLVVVTLLGTSLGTLLELGEFALDVLFNSFNQRGLMDTNLDLVFDLIGALAAAIYLAWTEPLT